MADKAWKAFERRVARDWGSDRNPLSGGNSKVTRSDTRHPRLFVECKHGAKSVFWTLWLKTRELAKREQKTAVLCLGNKQHPGYLVACHVDDLLVIAAELLDADGFKHTGDLLRKISQDRLDDVGPTP